MRGGALSHARRTSNGSGLIATTTQQVITFYVGDRSRQSARQLWKRISEVYRRHATFYTDDYDPDKGVIPAAQHQVRAKGRRPHECD